jgi:hypothetical protein
MPDTDAAFADAKWLLLLETLLRCNTKLRKKMA